VAPLFPSGAFCAKADTGIAMANVRDNISANMTVNRTFIDWNTK
jgi:hypothetical protein